MASHSLGRLIVTLANILHMLIEVYTFVILIAVIISWVGADPYNPIVRFLRQLTEPVFSRIRRILPAIFFRSGFDFTPLFVLIILVLIQNVGIGFLLELGHQFLR